MSLFDHTRYKVVTEAQHLYEHSLAEFSYGHPALPSTPSTPFNAETTLDYILNVLYPKIKAPVLTSADLPTGIDTPNIGDVVPTDFDQRIVQDDGDGNAALYMFYQQDGQVASQWNKIADMDFGSSSVISAIMDQTQYLFVRKQGTTDYDPVTEFKRGPDNGEAVDYFGQHIYGGDEATGNLILHAANGGSGGVVAFDDPARPVADLSYDFGSAAQRWATGYFGSLVVGTASMTITSDGVTGLITDTNGAISFDDENLLTTGDFNGSIVTAATNLVVDDTVNQLTIGIGSITDSTGAISFGNENLSTTGTFASGILTIDNTLILATGSITDSTGFISFGDETLTTTGDLNAAIGTLSRLLIDDLALDGNTISISTLDTDLALSANGTGVVDVQSPLSAISTTVTGVMTVIGSAVIDSITLDGTAVSVVGDILTTPSLIPDVVDTRNIGDGTNKYGTLFLNTGISDGTNLVRTAELMSLSRVRHRDVAETVDAVDGDILIYNSAADRFLASTAGGSNNYIATHTEVILGSPITVAGIGQPMDDARNALWQLTEESTGEVMNVPIAKSMATVTILNTVPLPVGNYKLIGIEVV